jgi:hypothetical protein
MTFEFLKDKYPKNGIVIVNSFTELQAVIMEHANIEGTPERLVIGIPYESLELCDFGEPDSVRSEFLNNDILRVLKVDIIVMMDMKRYFRGWNL